MSSRSSGFKFIDLPTAAERVGLTRVALLQLVEQGRIRPFSGAGQQSVFRTSDVERLGAELAAAESQPETPTIAPHEVPKGDEKPRKRDPIKLVGTRISQDSRWAEITDRDIEVWLDALEPVQFDRVRRVAGIAVIRIQRLLTMLDEHELKLESNARLE